MYTPNPEDTSKVELSAEILELAEAIAENTHENWAKTKLSEGWVYGEKLDKENRTHPCLVPYCELGEQDKEYDRVTAMEAIKFLVKKGYKISR
ncbi:MAG: Ryanodine receptor Ryr [Ruminococcaceae bacterium]|nr:Ryanodine receptor Ryr [Oscillospiraceae bacterium]